MGGTRPKQFREFADGEAVLHLSIDTFHDLEAVGQIVLILPALNFETARDALPLERWPKLVTVPGGEQRWESVALGFEALDKSYSHVLIHDVARPFVTAGCIRRCMEVLAGGECVLAALPATDTVKEVEGDAVVRTLDRSRLVLVQTPQGFPRAVLAALYARDWSGSAPTDEAQMAEAAGFKVHWVKGHDRNRKLTHGEDWDWAQWTRERILQGQAEQDD